MKPYFEENGITLYHGDARERLTFVRSLVEGLVALVSDVPYGMNASFNRTGLRDRTTLGSEVYHSRNWKPIEGDSEPFDPSHLLGFPFVALFGANHYANKLPACSKWLVWDKRCGSEPDNNSDVEFIWTNQTGAARMYSHKWRGIVREGEENLSRSWKLHPAQKPVALMRWVIKQLNLPAGATIIDPYMGSGSTLVAAKDLGFKSIGIDIDEEHCATAAGRMTEVRQGVLGLATC